MLNKIEQYLLTNYPIVWNLRIVRIGLIALGLHLLFFAMAYLVTTPTPKEYFYNQTGTYIFLFGCSILAIILVFIFWLIQYSKHNALKAFYPQSTLSRYTEWLLTFALCAFIGLMPYSLIMGKDTKWKTTVSRHEYQEAKKIIARITPLLPSNEYSFRLDSNTTPLRVGDAKVDRTKFDTGLFTYEEDASTPDNPIEYIGPSLLYYNDSYHYYASDQDKVEMSKVHQWLVTEQRDSIKATIQAFLNLQGKYRLQSNIDVDRWMKIIYNPPLYPIDKKNMISEYSSESYRDSNLYTELGTLSSFYREADNIYGSDESANWHLLITIVIAMGISVMIFSARLTGGRSWVFALLSLGVLSFIFPLFIGFIALTGGYGSWLGKFIPTGFWLCTLAIVSWKIASKISNQESKGRSRIYVNLFIWFIPALVPLFYQMYIFAIDTKSSDHDLEHLTYIVGIANVVYTVAVMYPICILAKKWKALPEN